MTKLWVILLLWTGVIISAGCSSSSDEEEVQTIDAPQDGEEVVEEVEEIIDDSGEGYEIVDDTQAGLPDEVTTTVDDRQTYMEPGEETAMDSAAPSDLIEEEEMEPAAPPTEAPIMEPDSYAQAPGSDSFAMDPGGTEMPMTEEQMAEDSYSDMGTPPMGTPMGTPMDTEAEPKKNYVPVKKISDLPWSKDGLAVNAVYIVRPGDTMDSISQKIYGNASRADELYNINPHLRRSMKVGDKVYYNSPVRPNDMNTILTFYEDNGVPSELYLSKPGDNIREVATNLLGHERSWMEVWATNPNVESKWALSAGTELRYWPPNIAVGGPAVPDEPAPAELPVEEPQGMAAEKPPADPLPESSMSDVEPEAPTDMAEALPPPSDMDDVTLPDEAATPPPPPPMDTGEPQDIADLGAGMDTGGTMDTPPPPPIEPMGTPSLPDEAVAPPPPPPKPPVKKPRPQKVESGGLDAFLADEFNLMLAAGVLFILVAGALIVIRKRRQSKRINLGETQV